MQMAHINGEITIAAPAEQVFDMIADERNEPRYNPRIARAEKTSQGPVGPGTRFTAQPGGMGAAGVMTVEIVGYDRPRRLVTSIRSSYLDVDGTLTFDQADGGTRMRWSWDMRLRGAMRALSPVVRAIGPRWEHRNWAGLKQFMESGREAQAG
jgi:carbon monoxide dehydrogenase subunit G